MKLLLTPEELAVLSETLEYGIQEAVEHERNGGQPDIKVDLARDLLSRINAIPARGKRSYRCPKCGSNKIQSAEWTDPNDDDRIVDGDPPLSDSVWCEACESHSFGYCLKSSAKGPCYSHDYPADEACRPKKKETAT